MTEATAKNLFSRFVELIINELFTARIRLGKVDFRERFRCEPEEMWLAQA